MDTCCARVPFLSSALPVSWNDDRSVTNVKQCTSVERMMKETSKRDPTWQLQCSSVKDHTLVSLEDIALFMVIRQLAGKSQPISSGTCLHTDSYSYFQFK